MATLDQLEMARIQFSGDDNVHTVRSNLHATAILNTNDGGSNGLGLRNLSCRALGGSGSRC